MQAIKQHPASHSTLHWLSTVASKSKLYIVLLMVVQAALGISGVCHALLLRQIINAAVDADRRGFFHALVSFAVLIILQIALRSVNRFLEEFTRSALENRFKGRLFSELLIRDYASVTRIHSGEWMNRLTSDTVVVADALTQIIPGVAGMAVKIVGALAAILWMEPRFLYILVPGGALLIFFTYAFRKVLKRLHKKIQEADGRLRVFLSERIGSLMIVRTFAQEKRTVDQAEKLMEEHRSSRMKRNHFSNLCNIGFGTAMNGAYVLGAAFCGYGILTGTMSYGNFMAVLQLIGQIQNPFANITGYLPKYYAMIASAERLMEAEVYEDDSKEMLSKEMISDFYEKQFRGMGLRNASFTYQPPAQVKDMPAGAHSNGPDQAMPVVLRGLSLEIRKGEYVAFTGPSGCGKSTVLKLLMCLYPLDGGERYLMSNGMELSFGAENQALTGFCPSLTGHCLPLTGAWRGLFAYVPQGNQLLSGTIREILAFGDPEKMAREEELWQALRIACAQEFVEKLEQRMDTVLGERGAGLSEGQMQRIAIARAIFSGHPILLLDEATSSLDEATEARLLENLRSMTNKTVVIVTHRRSVLQICDRQIDFEAFQSEGQEREEKNEDR